MDLNLIVAIGKKGEIGKDGDLIWKIGADLKRFKDLTLGHPVIMGRKTWESLPKKPLPGRRNIILSRRSDFKPEGAEVTPSVDEALNLTQGESPFVIGGAQVYEAFLPYVTRLYLTEVDDTCADADSFLNLNLNAGWEKTEESETLTTPEGISYRYVTYQKVGKP